MTNYTNLTDDEICKKISEMKDLKVVKMYTHNWLWAGELLEEMGKDNPLLSLDSSGDGWRVDHDDAELSWNENPRRAIAEAYLHYKSP